MKQSELNIETFGFSEVLNTWRRFDADSVKLPYQSIDWLQAWVTHLRSPGARPFIVLGRVGDRVVFVLPLMTQTVLGVSVCRWLGGGQQNINAGHFDRDWLRETYRGDVVELLTVIGRENPQIALFHLERQPQELFGLPNPLAAVGTTICHSDPLYCSMMGEDFEEWEKTRRSRGSRNRLRRRLKHLEEARGKVRILKARTEGEANAIIAAFMRQREHSAHTGRIPNPFASWRAKSFITSAALSGLGKNDGLHLFSLQAGGEIVAVSMALKSGLRHSGFAISMDESYSEFSPGKLLEREVLKQQHEAGVREIDFGIGDNVYKSEWTDKTELTDSFVPLCAKGRAVAIVLRYATEVKGTLKSSRLFRSSLRIVRSTISRSN